MLLPLLPCLLGAASGDDGFRTSATTREAFAQPAPALSETDRPAFFLGRNLFRQVWVVAPAEDGAVDGLGPVYNRLSCIACHAKNGRGFAPVGPQEELRAMLVRLSVPGVGADGGPLPHPVYGDQLNELAIPGVTAEGRAVVHYDDHIVELAGGERVVMRRPVLSFRGLQFGPLGDDIETSARIGPAVYGLGLLEAVPDAALEARARSHGGRVNRVWDVARRASAIGRFGAKANQSTLRQQIAAAFHGDLGITSTLFPDENCTAAQMVCRHAESGGAPELTDDQLDAVELYLQLLAVPARRDIAQPDVQRGEALFASFGCANCHAPALPIADHPRRPEIRAGTIRPYTDLLLHDLGDDLADGRSDFLANGREWRTAPLWGIGLAERVGERVGYLHDGRARTVQEAILWHGGEAEPARERYRRAEPHERRALLRFLESL